MKELDYDLVIKYLDSECSPEELSTVEKWMESDGSIRNEIEVLRKVWSIEENKLPTPDLENALRNVKSRISSDNSANVYSITSGENVSVFTKFRTSGILKVAAVFLIGLISLLTYFSLSTSPDIQILVPTQQTQIVNLSDGSKVILDAGSVFTYPEEFGGETREVVLEGEGFFDIAPNAEKPFIVKTNQASVTVLGTEFNLRSWDNSGKITLAVIEGKVSFTNESKKKEAVLVTKGMVSSIVNNEIPTEPELTDVNKYVSWQKKEIQFQNSNLSEVLSQLERWYGLSFTLPDDSFLKNKVTINLKDEGIDQIVNLVSAVMSFDYSIDGKTVTFTNQ